MVAALLCDQAQKSQQNKKTQNHKKNSCISCTPSFAISFLLLEDTSQVFSFLSFTTFRFHLVSLVIQRIRKGLVGVFVWLEFSSLFFPYLFFSFFFDLYLISCPSSLFYITITSGFGSLQGKIRCISFFHSLQPDLLHMAVDLL